MSTSRWPVPGLAAVALVAACAVSPADHAAASDVETSTTLMVDVDRQPDEVIPLWPDGAPGGQAVTVTEHVVARDSPPGLPDRAALDITRPTLSVFRARKPNGAAILIIPGGGYARVVIDREGWESARWFSRFTGASAYVMTYRLPHQGWGAGPDTPLQDAQRAMRLIRSRAADDGVDPARVMVMGFSAGGHLAGMLTTRSGAEVYAPVDDADRLSARPDATALIYPVVSMRPGVGHAGSRENLIGKSPDEATLHAYSIDEALLDGAPPVFLIAAEDDATVPVENSLRLFAALKAAGVPAEMHLYPSGGHGFGLRGAEGKPIAAWPTLVARWVRANGALR